MRYLIINADDFGMCPSANEAIFALFRSGCLKSSTVMIPCPAAREAVKFAAENPQYAVGVHLTTTNEWKENWPWGPITKGKSLMTPEGRMWPENEDFEAHCTYKEAIAEARAQIDLAREWGLKPVQADNHMGSLYGMNGKYLMLPKIFKLCKQEKLPFRMCVNPKAEYCPDGVDYKLYAFFCKLSKMISKMYKVYTPDYLILTDQVKCLHGVKTYEEFRDKFLEFHGNIDEGITETFIHPALDTEELRSITGSWERRSWEYRMMKDPVTHEFFKSKGIELISYRELIEIREGKR
ncbi:MAG: polysaccharide deacetylase family protein [Clostridia bacterium]|nr:polysaccharide deacetylase family protein [Clostridia bacterium]